MGNFKQLSSSVQYLERVFIYIINIDSEINCIPVISNTFILLLIAIHILKKVIL